MEFAVNGMQTNGPCVEKIMKKRKTARWNRSKEVSEGIQVGPACFATTFRFVS